MYTVCASVSVQAMDDTDATDASRHSNIAITLRCIHR